MGDKRIPKVGEVWTHCGGTRTVWAVEGGIVAFECGDGDRGIVDVDYFIQTYDPPEPTVVGSRWLAASDGSVAKFYAFSYLDAYATHRLDLMSDGEFRVVKL